MKTTNISGADIQEYVPDCGPGETVNIVGVLGEPDAAGNYPLEVSAITKQEAAPEEEGEEEEMPPPPPPPPKRKRPAVSAVLAEEEV